MSFFKGLRGIKKCNLEHGVGSHYGVTCNKGFPGMLLVILQAPTAHGEPQFVYVFGASRRSSQS